MAIEPGWLSLLPPLAAIVLALVTREVVLSLFAGVWLGALILSGYDPVRGSGAALDFMLESLTDADHVSIILFSMLLAGMVGIISRNGGTHGFVDRLAGLATNRRRGQLFTWIAGIAIFFDDYANTLIVGHSMRPTTDRLRVSREKLSYIVDSTAAPVTVLAVVTTWIGFEITQIGDALSTAAAQATDPALQAELTAGAANPFNVFLHSIPYLFYPILALAFVLLVIVTGRDFGPMLRAERRAAAGGGVLREGAQPAADLSHGGLTPIEGRPRRWYNAGIPVLAVLAVAVVSLYATGAAALEPEERTLRAILGEADPFSSLLWASFVGLVLAIALSVGQRILSVQEAVSAGVAGMQAMLTAVVILILAWSLGGVTEAMGTGPYLAGLLQETLPLPSLPVIVFLVAAAMSFASGTSWGTMAVLFPVVIPLAVAMGAGIGFAGGDNYTILLGAISSVMAGSIFGDHASPISDTTVLSSMATACDHVDHVRTQLPYALTVAGVGVLVGDIPTALGFPPALSLVIGLGILYGVLRVLGRPVETMELAAEGNPSGREGATAVATVRDGS